ncbi:MAG: hypothetical protein LBG99_00905 [Propionibacteriaceae bacterium]|nr:hypothetical protein [Propionibacteriaceae bacterium]
MEVDNFGTISIDEAQQELVWTVTTQGTDWQLRQEVTEDTVHGADTLLSWDAEKAILACILARRITVRGRTIWEPATLFLKTSKGIRLASLDFQKSIRMRLTSMLHKSWALILKRWKTAPKPPALLRSTIAKACNDCRELLVDCAATERLHPTTEQRGRLEELASLFDECALGTLGRLTRDLLAHPDPSKLLIF